MCDADPLPLTISIGKYTVYAVQRIVVELFYTQSAPHLSVPCLSPSRAAALFSRSSGGWIMEG